MEKLGLDMKEELFKYIKKKYKAEPEYLWHQYPDYAVFRHADNNKWFALVAPVERNKLAGLEGEEVVDIINVKVDDIFFRDMLIKEEGIVPAYHMNKQHWVTILLDGTVPEQRIHDLLQMSFDATAPKKKKD